MRKVLFLFLVMHPLSNLAWGQHYQLLVNDITACNTYSCIEALLKKNKAVGEYTPVKKELGMDAQRILFDFEYPYKIKEESFTKSYRLSLFISGDSIYYGMLDQLSGKELETSYLFKNNALQLKNHVAAYNKQHKTSHSYKDLVHAITSREPGFWMWRN